MKQKSHTLKTSEPRGFSEQILLDMAVSKQHHEESAADAMDRLLLKSPSKTQNQEKLRSKSN